MTRIITCLCLFSVLLLTSCTEPDEKKDSTARQMDLETEADSLAMMMVTAMGGLDTWENIRFVRFDFSTEGESGRRPARRHLWDKYDGRYRLEYQVGEDSSVTVVFNTADTLGTAFINGAQVDSIQNDRYVSQAHRMYINDIYWLMAPFKVFDEGVQRGMEEKDGAATLTLSFDSVGYTPGDRYWISISSETGEVEGWTYLLQGRTNQTTYAWVDYTTVDSPSGPLRVSMRKASPTFSIHTDNVSFPESIESRLFESGESLLR
ncbi:MAG: hypothetical protein HKN43_11220 [Rhodothermales bacterium]|nr:hypothetical protein [Rhodothermales bacterium]